MLRGSSVVQRHVALPADVAIHAGKGITVRPPPTGAAACPNLVFPVHTSSNSQHLTW